MRDRIRVIESREHIIEGHAAAANGTDPDGMNEQVKVAGAHIDDSTNRLVELIADGDIIILRLNGDEGGAGCDANTNVGKGVPVDVAHGVRAAAGSDPRTIDDGGLIVEGVAARRKVVGNRQIIEAIP